MLGKQDGPRRSGRNRIRTKRYTDDAFAELDDSDLPGDVSASQREIQFAEVESHSGDEYIADEHDTQSVDEDNEDQNNHTSYGLAVDAQASDAESVASHHNGSDSEPGLEENHRPRQRQAGKNQAKTQTSNNEPYSRRLLSQPKYSYKPYYVLNSYSESDPHREALVRAIFRWFADVTFPTRLPDEKNVGGFRKSLFVTETQLSDMELTGWNWYYETRGHNAFDLRAHSQVLSVSESKAYLNNGDTLHRSVLVGIPGRYSLLHLAPYQPIQVNGPEVHHLSSEDGENVPGFLPNPESHWLINVGVTAQHVDWAPNNTGGSQYLAVSTWSKELAEGSSAFVSSSLNPASIQIWEVHASQTNLDRLRINNEERPKLRIVLCFDWGMVKHLKWCPISSTRQRNSSDHNSDFIGLLAAVFADGAVRVFDVQLPKTLREETQYIYYNATAFESVPPETVCTCITWITPSILAAGCANGFVAVWDLASTVCNPNSPSNVPPVVYQALHSTVITTIVSCQPSRPHLVLTSSMDGLIRLTDLRNPNMDYAYQQKTRLGTIPLVWQEQVQHFFCADEAQYLKCVNIRRLFRTFRSCEVEAAVFCLASSPVHTCILIGTADGSVIATNPLRSLIELRYMRASSQYRQKWFSHQWRRGRSAERNKDDEAMDLEGQDTGNDGQDLSQQALDFPSGLSRLVTEYPPTQRASRPVWEQDPNEQEQTLQAKKKKTKKDQDVSAAQNRYQEVRYGPSGVSFTAIHEEETGVRCVAWHPDVQCGGWAAAGLGSGLVVIGDLAVDR